ncbi:unnamed protein product [Kluyveromyces dobzhanskii CBS 2104]|uniref:WGS project CCBQ000000000 data, contig MAT n=1 Tax=Kluyveromyces dobzhanskii CBS 2104 TaxID=1427455 RepID=A0A0A8L160_9SACH|nr:unnamed protein product [Kluyveromyces dobzhanskii CBS 2104]
MSRPIFKIYKEDRVTFQQRLQDGYVCLDQFIPLLSNLSSFEFHGDDSLFENRDDMITSQFNILIDTDRSGTRWITLQKAHELWDLLQIQNDTGADNLTDHDEEDGNDDTVAGNQEPIEKSERTTNTKELENGITVNKNNGNNISETGTKNNDGEETNYKQGSTTNDSASKTDRESATSKHELLEPADSPTKRHQSKSVLKIPVYHHDLPTVSTLQKTLPPVSNYTNDERGKLETLLQRILFPESANLNSTEGYPSINLIQQVQELDAQFPNVPLNLNIPIDEHGNTSLHWLCSIANLDLLKQLIVFGSDRRIGDKSGESVLVKSVKSVNNYDSGTFETLLDYLYPCIVMVDEMDRTVLHHIVITSGMPGCNAAAKYYLDILMGWIVKKQGRTKESHCALLEEVDLQWVIAHLLNARDTNGDTCLNIAARLGNVAIVEALLDYGADPNVANNSGLCPIDFGAGTQPRFQSTTKDILNIPTKVLETALDPMAESTSLITNIKSLLSKISDDYTDEVNTHSEKMKELLEVLNAKREALANARDRLAKAKQIQDEYDLLSDRLNNVENTISEEDKNFQLASRELGLSLDDVQAEGLNSVDVAFDADEPFRISYVYTKFEEKIKDEYNNDFELFLKHCDMSQLVHELYENFPSRAEIPHPKVLKARIKAYNRNESHLDSTLLTIENKQKNLESKFRKVLSLCLKIDEEKVDSMLDGLLQAISNEDPEDIDTDEVNNFLETTTE